MQRFTISIVLSILVVLISQSCSGSKEADSKNMDQIYQEEGVPVRIREMAFQSFTSRYHYNAILSGLQESSAFASFGDRIEKIYYKVGDYVKKDQVVVTFPTDNVQAHYQQAKVAFENAKKMFDRISTLYKSGGVSQQNYDNVRTSFDVAKANWDAARKAIKVKAPINGYITKINVTESQNVDKRALLFTVANIKKLKAHIWVSENEICDLKVGQKAEAVWKDVHIFGRVVQVDMAINLHHQAFGVILEFDNPHNKMFCGATADIYVTAYQNPKDLVIARKNMITSEGKSYVFITRGNKAEKKSIVPGREDELNVEVLSGLSAGDSLIVEGQILLKDGSKIKIIQ